MRIRITERDIEVLRWIAILRYVSTSLIATFFFNGNIKVTRRRLHRMFSGSYLSWFEKPSTSQGRWERVYHLNKHCKEEIRYLLGMNDISFYSPPKNPIFVIHNLEIAHFILCLRAACNTSQEYSFSCFLGHNAKGQAGSEEGLPLIGRNKASFTADSLIILKGTKGQALIFLENDTGKESIKGSFKNKADFRKKLKAYIEYLGCRGYRKLSKRFGYQFKGFRVLVVTTPSRLDKIEHLCNEIDTRGIVWLTSSNKISADLLFNPIWDIPCASTKGCQSIIKSKVLKIGEGRQR